MRQLKLLLFTLDGMPVYHKFRPTFYLCESKEFFPRTQKRDPVRAQTPFIPSGIQFTGLTNTFLTKKKFLLNLGI